MEAILPAVVAYLILAVVLLWVSKAGASGALKTNGAVGIRTSQTQKSPQAWTGAHRAFIPYAVAVAVSCGIFTLALFILYFTNFSSEEIGTMIIASYVIIIGLVLAGGVKAHRVAKDLNKTEA